MKLQIKQPVFKKKSFRELHSQNDEGNKEIEIPKERYISPEKKDNKLLMN